MSKTVETVENLVNFVTNNMERLKRKEKTICKTPEGVTVRDKLPCAATDDIGDYIIKCEHCPFHTVESHQATINELNNNVIKKQKVMDILIGERT